jgi:enoyl-CoA hydratase/carnithine racemase
VDEALTWGLVNRVVDGDVLEMAKELTADTLGADRAHATAIKRLIG